MLSGLDIQVSAAPGVARSQQDVDRGPAACGPVLRFRIIAPEARRKLGSRQKRAVLRAVRSTCVCNSLRFDYRRSGGGSELVPHRRRFGGRPLVCHCGAYSSGGRAVALLAGGEGHMLRDMFMNCFCLHGNRRIRQRELSERSERRRRLCPACADVCVI